MTSFWLRHQVTSPKLRYQNGVTKKFPFSSPPPPPLAKSWLRPCARVLQLRCIALHGKELDFWS